jgi:hypothetical protein
MVRMGLAGGPVEAVRGLTREQGIALLDRAAEVGLLTAYGDGYYAIHPALPWYFGELFTTAYGLAGSSAVQQATRAYTSAIARLGDYYHNEYERGRWRVVGVLGAEEANLLHARRLARIHGCWDTVMGAMQGLRTLYGHTGRTVEWAQPVAVVDHQVLQWRRLAHLGSPGELIGVDVAARALQVDGLGAAGAIVGEPGQLLALVDDLLDAAGLAAAKLDRLGRLLAHTPSPSRVRS